MSDLDQLREALDLWASDHQPSPHSPAESAKSLAHAIEFAPLADAARELLTIREAGALIITPDEDGWPVWAQALVMNVSENTIRMGREIPRDACRRLDALRDAMPDGDS